MWTSRLATLVPAMVLLTSSTAWSVVAGDPVDDELLVKFYGEPPLALSSSLLAAGVDSLSPFLPQGSALSSEAIGHWAHAILTPGTDDAQAIAVLAADPTVELVIQNVYGEPLLVPNDPLFPLQWSLHNTGQSVAGTSGTPDADVDGPEAWNTETGGPAVVVAITDSGIDYTHPDLAGNLWHNPGEVAGNGLDDDGNGYVDDVFGMDFFSSDADPFDVVSGGNPGHGTHVAGIVGAVGNNALGVSGVAWDVQLMAVRWLGPFPLFGTLTGTCDGALRAVVYSVLEGADVINASWRIPFCTQPLTDAITLAQNLGVLFVAAAGNDTTDNDVVVFEPATLPVSNILAVAATNHNDQVATFSNFGHYTVEIAAPGFSVSSTLSGGTYGSLSGTSMAAPHVSGVAALVLGQHPAATPLDLKEVMVLAADSKPALSGKVIAGGRLNASRALALAASSISQPGHLWVCDDEIDNDGDGLADFPSDPGCEDVFPADRENPQCDDGLDNDGDGWTDYPSDPQCVAGWDPFEKTDPTSCGLGFELAFLLSALLWISAGRRATRRLG